MALQKNQEWELSVEGMSAEGFGVCRAAGDDGRQMVVFVPFSAVGDRIVCRIVRVQKTFAFGKLIRVITPSPDRVAQMDCPVFGKCGGCVFRHVTYEAELRYKQQRVTDALSRIAGWDGEVAPIVPCVTPDHYRNKAQYPVAAGDKGIEAGFFALHSHRVVPHGDCRLQPERFAPLIGTVLEWARENGISPYDEQTHKGLLRHIYLRKGVRTGETMVCLVCTSGKLPATQSLVEALVACDKHVVSVSVNLNRDDTNVILGERGFVLYGKESIDDELCGLTFSLSPKSFYQVNHDQAERLYGLAADAAGLSGHETVLDLYGGIGTIGLSMASRAGEIIGVEVIPEAVEDAKRNAARNGITNARFLCGDAAKAAEQLRREGVHPDVVVVDPPRKGCDEALLATVAEMAPRRVVYVSCDPGTLARDVKRLSERGYRLERATPVDMFPRTAHVETVVLMSRAN